MAQPSPLAAARRSSELGLVIMAAGITAVAYVLASLGENAEIPARLVPFLIAILGLHRPGGTIRADGWFKGHDAGEVDEHVGELVSTA